MKRECFDGGRQYFCELVREEDIGKFGIAVRIERVVLATCETGIAFERFEKSLTAASLVQ